MPGKRSLKEITVNYRVLSRLVAAFYLIVSISLLTEILLRLCYNVVHWKIKLVSYSMIIFLLYAACLPFCFISIMSNVRLLNATKKNTLHTAIILCDIWGIWAWTTLCGGVIVFMVNSYYQFTTELYDHQTGVLGVLKNFETWKYVLKNVLLFILHGLALRCVHKFKKNLKTVNFQSMMELMLPHTSAKI